MTTEEKLKRLFDEAMLEPEPEPATRMVALPRYPNGSQAPAGSAPRMEPTDARNVMLERVSRMKEFLPKL